MADNTKPDPTKTYDARFSSNLTSAQIASSTDKRDKLVIASDTEDVTVITKTQKRNIPFDAEANAVNSVNGEIGTVVLDLGEDNNISDANATALTDGGETALHSHAGSGGSAILSVKPYTGTIDVAIGDSNFEGLTAENRSSLMNYLPAHMNGQTILNLAVGSKTVEEIRDEQLPRAIALKPKRIHIMCGTNDVLSAIPTATTTGAIDDINSAIIDADIEPVWFTILPIDDARSTNIFAINDHIKDKLGAVKVVDMNDRFIAWANKTIYGYEQVGDNIHLNEAGQKEAALLASNIVRPLETPKVLRTSGLTLNTTSNDCPNPNDFSLWPTQTALEAWTTGEDDPDGGTTAQGMVATTADTEHSVSVSVTGLVGDIFNGVAVSSGESDWCWIVNETTGAGCMVHPASGALGSDSVMNGEFSIVNYEGFTFVSFESVAVGTTSTFKIHACRTPYSGDVAFAGNGALPELYIWQAFQGVDSLPVFNEDLTPQTLSIQGVEAEKLDDSLSETLVTKNIENLFKYPNDFLSNDYWSFEEAAVITAAQNVPKLHASDEITVANGFIDSNGVDTTGNHRLRPRTSYQFRLKVSTRYTYSIPIKTNTLDNLYFWDSTATMAGYINATTGVVGTTIGDVNLAAYQIDADWSLIQFSFISSAGGASDSVFIMPSTSNATGGESYLGTGATTFFFGKAQLREGDVGLDYAYSPNYNTGQKRLMRQTAPAQFTAL